ncbi:MAG TPA: O-antigen ligase family protein [Crocinitomicaceae bacterium]|nr:O-antigen ligase family protein [Crocinitomicaceae bacterium]
MTQQQKFGTFDLYFLIVLLFTLVFVPFIPLSESFNFALEELLLLYPLSRLLLSRNLKFNTFTIVTFLFALYIVFTIVINGHFKQLNEYFEVVKIIKFLVVFGFSNMVFQGTEVTLKEKLVKAIHVIFIVAFIINLIHFFDFFNFTRSFLIYYDSNSINIQFYGLNSLGEPSAKRIVGTFGNPNENGIFFLFLMLFYSSRIKYTSKSYISFDFLGLVGSSLMVFLTQSRTSILILFALFCVHGLFHWKAKWYVLTEILIVALCGYFLFNTNANSMDYINNTSVVVTENNSVLGRLDIWKSLLNQWLEKPIFGYGPNKNYIYENHIYPENEYIFFLWRYGIVGLLFYLYLVFQPLVMLGKNILKNEFAVGLITIISVSALTNIPFFNAKFLIIIALCFGYLATVKNLKNA